MAAAAIVPSRTRLARPGSRGVNQARIIASYMKSIQSLMPGVMDLVTLHDMASVVA
jgi:hypothetical protein